MTAFALWRAPRAVSALGWAAFAVAIATALGGCKTTTTVVEKPETAATTGAGSEADPHRRAKVRLELAAGYYQKGQLDVALNEATEAVRLDPDLASAYSMLGLIQMDLQQNRQAEDNFKHALQLAPNDPESNNDFGWFLCRTRREREAVTYFDRAASNRLYSTPAMALENAGICLRQIGEDQRAEEYLKRALEADVTSPVAKYQLARLYLDTHRADRAQFYYDLLTQTAEPSAQTLWLGARIAHARSDSQTERRLSDELRGRFPNAPETALLNRGAFHE